MQSVTGLSINRKNIIPRQNSGMALFPDTNPNRTIQAAHSDHIEIKKLTQKRNLHFSGNGAQQEIEQGVLQLISARKNYIRLRLTSDSTAVDNALDALDDKEEALIDLLKQNTDFSVDTHLSLKHGHKPLPISGTLLDLSIYYAWPSVTEFLLSQDADLTHKNSFKLTPLVLAKRVQRDPQYNSAIQVGVDPSITDHFFGDREEILELLTNKFKAQSSKSVSTQRAAQANERGHKPAPYVGKSSRPTPVKKDSESTETPKKLTGRQKLEKEERDRKEALQREQDTLRLERRKEREAEKAKEEKLKADYVARLQRMQGVLKTSTLLAKSITDETPKRKPGRNDNELSAPHAREPKTLTIGNKWTKKGKPAKVQPTVQDKKTSKKTQPVRKGMPKEGSIPTSAWKKPWEANQTEAMSPQTEEFGSPTATFVGSFDSQVFSPNPQTEDSASIPPKPSQKDEASRTRSSTISIDPTSYSPQSTTVFSTSSNLMPGLMIMGAMENSRKTLLLAQVQHENDARILAREKRTGMHRQEIIEDEKYRRKLLKKDYDRKIEQVEVLKRDLSKRITQVGDLLKAKSFDKRAYEKKISELEKQVRDLQLKQATLDDIQQAPFVDDASFVPEDSTIEEDQGYVSQRSFHKKLT